MKIAISAIAKNEAKHVKRFCESARGADYIVIADTGSTDDTVTLACAYGAIVRKISIKPWRFDHARNAALALVPDDVDVVVCLDLDEVLTEGWREEIERVWKPETTRLHHKFDFGNGHIYRAQRVHSRHGYFWKFPCHEFQVADNRLLESHAHTEKVLIRHKPDKVKSRGQYMDMLQAAIRENPDCARSRFYYARELYYYDRWQDAIDNFSKYLIIPSATWAAERCFAIRVIGECYDKLLDEKQAEMFFLRACAECPELRDPWLSLARHYYRRQQWEECLAAIARMLRITTRTYEFVALPEPWGSEPYDLAALAAYHMGNKELAMQYGQEALYLDPDNDRLRNNLKWYVSE